VCVCVCTELVGSRGKQKGHRVIVAERGQRGGSVYTVCRKG